LRCSIRRLLLSRLEANLNLGSHFDEVACAEPEADTELRPRNGFTELHPGFERSNFSFRPYIPLCSEPLRSCGAPTRGAGCTVGPSIRNARCLSPGNRDFGECPSPRPQRAFFRFRESAPFLEATGSSRLPGKIPPGGYRSHRGAQNRGVTAGLIEGKARASISVHERHSLLGAHKPFCH